MKVIYFFVIFILFTSFGISSKTLFDTKFYEIKFSSNNVIEVKKNKIKDIKVQSLSNIFQDILIKKDFKKIRNKLDENLVNTLIKNIIIEDEKIINNNYYSNVKINFNKKKLIKYIRELKFSYVEFYPQNFLTIIYENYSINKSLFSKNNNHYNYLINNKDLSNFYMTPNLDINDRFLLNINDIENFNKIKFDKFLKKYQTSEAILINVTKIDSNKNYKIYLYNQDEFLEIKNLKFDNHNYPIIFEKIKLEVIDLWKTKNNIQNKTFDQILCQVNYYNLLELKQIKLNINNISLIKDILLKQISYKKNTYNIMYYGNKNFLPKLFNLYGLNIRIDENICKITLK